MDSWLARVEQCLRELRWTGRELDRRSGLTPTLWAQTAKRLREKPDARPSAQTVDAVVGALVAEGYSETWLRRGEGQPRGAPEGAPQPTRPSHRYAAAEDALRGLVEDGVPKERAEEIVGSVAFKLRDREPTAVELYRFALGVWHEGKGRPMLGARPIDEDETPPPPPAARKKGKR